MILSTILIRENEILTLVLQSNIKEFISLLPAQTTCNGGVGRVVYERLPDQQLQGFDDEVVSIKDP
jgi:hypothetical protein